MPTPIRQQIPHDVFDYQALLTALADYKHPRDRIKRLISHGDIVRVKKGLYVLGEDQRRHPIRLEVLANLIYGPSCVSLEYALQHHGLIPEQVRAVTSVTVNRSRTFDTPLGRFTYLTLPLKAFRAGVDRIEDAGGMAWLVANPERALCDKVYSDRVPLTSRKAVRTHLLEGLRIAPADLVSLDLDRLNDYAPRYDSRKVRQLVKVVERLQKGADHA